MKNKTIEEINKETPDSPNYYTDAIEYLNQFRISLPIRYNQVWPENAETIDDVMHDAQFFVDIAAKTMNYDDCLTLIAYAKRISGFNILIRHFTGDHKLPKWCVSVKIIASYIINIICAMDNDPLSKLLSLKK